MTNKGLWVFGFLWICLAAQPLEAQVTDWSFSTWFGFRDIQTERFAPTAQLDFLDYIRSNEVGPEDEYLGFALRMKFDNHTEFDGRFTVNSGWGLAGYNLKIRHYPIPFMGLSVGVLNQPLYLRHYDDYLINRDTEFYTDFRNGTTYKYYDAQDLGWMAGVVLPVNYRIFHLMLQLHGGVSTLKPFRDEFGQKQKNSNFRRDLVYETNLSYNWFFYPEACFSIDIVRIKKIRIGVQAQASWYLSNKYLDYKLTTYNWTYTDPITTHVESPGHRLAKLEYDVGLVFRF